VNQSAPEPVNHGASFLCHASAWYGLVFATPLWVALTNQQDISLSFSLLVPGLFALFLFLSFASWGLSSRRGPTLRKTFAAGMLAIAFMLAIQGNLIHTLTYFGYFDGSRVDFRKYGILFWVEWYGFLAGIVIFFYLLQRSRQISAWLPWIPILSFTLTLAPALFSTGNQFAGLKSTSYDDSVFDFSKSRNLVHLLPDALQSDIVEQVFHENPELAGRFRGFTLYSDHLGLYYGTAPTLPALFTGKPFEFERGHTYDWITPFIDEYSYQNDLADNGYALDLVPIAAAYCVSRAKSCVPRYFSGWKSWGYEQYRVDSALYSLKMLTDLTLYRLSPSFLKEKIYDQGEWMLAGSTLDGASPWPDPVIREWIDKIQVTDDAAHYKFYHYIGTHNPPFWTSDCKRQRGLARTRENFLGQAQCILQGIASLLEKLEEEGIYDQTAVIISGDHGHDIAPSDLSGPSQSVMLDMKMMGTARPALLVKRMASTEPLKISRQPTSMVDIAAIARSITGTVAPRIESFEAADITSETRDRYFHNYPVEKVARWSAEPIPHDIYRVRGPANEDSSWELLNLVADSPAPEQYPLINHAAVTGYMHGVSLNPADPDQKRAWIIRKQLAFLISVQAPVPDQPTLVLTLHIPAWIGEQAFSVRINETEMDTRFKVLIDTDIFWQEVRVDLPGQSLREGNNFISVKFDKLQLAPKENFSATGFLGSIHME
jgi:hypothetical protein